MFIKISKTVIWLLIFNLALRIIHIESFPLYRILHFSFLVFYETSIHTESKTHRRLKRKNEVYDIVVVSMGGTGCSNLLAKLGKIKYSGENKLTINSIH